MSDSGYEIRCPACREPMASTAEVCGACGHRLASAAQPALPFSAPRPEGPRAAATPVAAGMPIGAYLSSPAAPVSVTRGLRADGSLGYGGFWIRAVAYLIDTVVVWVPLYLLERTVGGWALVAVVAGFLYFPLMESSGSQATLGKLLCSLAVTDTSGRRISFGRALGRYLAKILSALPLYLGFAMAGWTAQKRALHDYVAGTLVVRT